jgi:hypothetical protein
MRTVGHLQSRFDVLCHRGVSDRPLRRKMVIGEEVAQPSVAEKSRDPSLTLYQPLGLSCPRMSRSITAIIPGRFLARYSR